MARARVECPKISILGRKRVCIQIRKPRRRKYKYGQFKQSPVNRLSIPS